MSQPNIANFLGLSDNEKEIIEVLKKQDSLRPIEIARSCPVSRTTINYNLKKLAERGIVQRVEIEGHSEWKAVDTKQIENKIDLLYDFFADVDRQYTKTTLPQKAGITGSAGIEALKDAYEESTSLNKGQRVYIIEGNNLENQIENFGNDYLIELQKKYQDSGVILEGVVGKSTLESFKNLKPELLQQYKNRLTVVYVVDDKFIDFDMHIIIYPTKVKFINHEQKLVLDVDNDFFRQSMMGCYKAMKAIGDKVLVNKEAEKQLS